MSIYVTGQYLARNKLPAHARAFLGADLRTGRIQLVDPTMGQVVALCRVSVPYIQLALKATNKQRCDVLDGIAPLALVQQQRHLALPVPATVPDPTDEDLVELVRMVGPERAFQAIEAVLP